MHTCLAAGSAVEPAVDVSQRSTGYLFNALFIKDFYDEQDFAFRRRSRKFLQPLKSGLQFIHILIHSFCGKIRFFINDKELTLPHHQIAHERITTRDLDSLSVLPPSIPPLPPVLSVAIMRGSVKDPGPQC